MCSCIDSGEGASFKWELYKLFNEEIKMQSQRDLPLQNFRPTVQVYAVTNDSTGQYELMGHGYLSILTDQFEEGSFHYIEVAKKTQGLLLRSRLRLVSNFQKQKGTVITWRDQQQKLHQQLAISFEQEKESDFFWYVPVRISRRLICQKIGKNYLDINARDTLEMPNEGNLTAILEKTRTSKDMVEYHLLNSKDFVINLTNTFKKFQQNGDRMGMGMIGRITKSILTNMDHRLVENMLGDPSFELILEVQSFNKNIDFMKCWSQRVKIKHILSLSTSLCSKIHLIHRIGFYREYLLDLMKQTYFEHILMLTHSECCKDIINQLIKDTILEDIVALQSLPNLFQPATKDITEDQTSTLQADVIKKRILAESKVDFLMEAILIAKQIQSDNLRVRFLDRIYKSDVMKMVMMMLDQNFLKALDFFSCLSQIHPQKFLQYLRQKFRQSPTDNLHSRLAKKYCLGTEQFQCSILQIIKSLGQCLKIKQNLDFFNGTFFTYVFECCKDEKAILLLLAQLQNIIENIETFFSHALKGKVFQKIMPFLRNMARDKLSQLRAVKVLKRILVENASPNRNFKASFLKQINGQIINSGFFEYCLELLGRNIHLNNIISSSMLQNLKIIKDLRHYTAYHNYIQLNSGSLAHLQKFIAQIIAVRPQQNNGNNQNANPFSHIEQLEEQRQQTYLMEDNANDVTIQAAISAEELKQQMLQLKRLRAQIEDSLQEKPAEITRKIHKPNEQPSSMKVSKRISDDMKGSPSTDCLELK